jgi:hypothetical protein
MNSRPDHANVITPGCCGYHEMLLDQLSDLVAQRSWTELLSIACSSVLYECERGRNRCALQLSAYRLLAIRMGCKAMVGKTVLEHNETCLELLGE